MTRAHEECQTIQDLKNEVRSMKGNSWKILSAVLVIVFGFGSCVNTMALYHASQTTKKFDHQRTLIDKNKEDLHSNETRYNKMEVTMETLVESAKEQREEQKKIVDSVHRIELAVNKIKK